MLQNTVSDQDLHLFYMFVYIQSSHANGKMGKSQEYENHCSWSGKYWDLVSVEGKTLELEISFSLTCIRDSDKDP